MLYPSYLGFVCLSKYLHEDDRKVFAFPNDIQWIGQAIVNSLSIMNELGFKGLCSWTKSGFKDNANIKCQKIKKGHSLEAYKESIKTYLIGNEIELSEAPLNSD